MGNGGEGTTEVVQALKMAIARGELKPRQRLVETLLCERFGVKRSKVREALQKLAHDGFVEITPMIGAVVSEFSRTDVEQIYDLLSVLDGMAVRLAIPFITEEQIAKLGSLVTEMETTDDPAMIYGSNCEFHIALCALSENKRLIDFAMNLRLSIESFALRSFYLPAQMAASRKEHREILQAIVDGDPTRAETVVRTHLLDAKTRLLKWMYKSL